MGKSRKARRLAAAEQENASDKDLAALISDVLSDEPRSGGPCTFSAEQLTQILAVACEKPQDCGRPVTRKEGILKSMASRRKFLEDPEHRIRFVYTPRHASWLNQVEIWFSILARRALKRASFRSLADLEQRLHDFIGYFNAVLAKPFKWTYAGKPLRAS